MPRQVVKTQRIDHIKAYTQELKDVCLRLESIIEKMEEKQISEFLVANQGMSVQGLRFCNRYADALGHAILNNQEKTRKEFADD